MIWTCYNHSDMIWTCYLQGSQFSVAAGYGSVSCGVLLGGFSFLSAGERLKLVQLPGCILALM